MYGVTRFLFPALTLVARSYALLLYGAVPVAIRETVFPVSLRFSYCAAGGLQKWVNWDTNYRKQQLVCPDLNGLSNIGTFSFG